jgi:hypothetical protein
MHIRAALVGYQKKLLFIIMKSSSDRDNNNRHYDVIKRRIASFAITLNYHPVECVGFAVAYHYLGS